MQMKNRAEYLAKTFRGDLLVSALDGHQAHTTAFMNAYAPLLCFAQQVNDFGFKGDVFMGISILGNSKNVLFAATVTKAKRMKVIGLTGAKNSKLAAMTDMH